MLPCSLVAVCMLITYLRDPNLYRLPIAAYEDGRDFFAFFYNHRGLQSIVRQYNGYVSLVPNLAGFLSAKLPTPAIPQALAWFPLTVTALGFARFSSIAYRPIVPSDTLRAFACLGLALAPVANRQFVSTTAYSIWGLLFLLLLGALGAPPVRRTPASLAVVVQSAIICSHPLSVVLLPIYLARLGYEWGAGRLRRVYYAVLATVAVLYQIFGVEHAGERIGNLWTAFKLSTLFLLESVVFATLFSERTARLYRRQGAEGRIFLTAIAVTATLALLVLLARRHLGRPRVFALAGLFYFLFSSTMAYVVGRGVTMEDLGAHGGQRYFWVQRLCFLLLAFLVVEATVRWSSRERARLAIALALLVIAGLQLYRLNGLDNHKYSARVGGYKLRAFTRHVAEQERSGDGSVEARLARGQWSIELHRPGRGDEP